MSVALLNRPQKDAEIPDDLESLFYVLLYHAVRYLKSNCPNVPDWLEDFFNVFSYFDGAYGCGHWKQNAIQTEQLVLKRATRTPLIFNSPMDELLGSLLDSFQAYYFVKAYDEKQQEAEAQSQLKTPTLSTSASGASRPRRKYDLTFKVDKQVLAQLAARRPPVRVPSEEQRELAKIVSNPQLFVAWLQRYAMMDWPADDKEGDRVPADWFDSTTIGPTNVPGYTPNKRQRKMSDTS